MSSRISAAHARPPRTLASDAPPSLEARVSDPITLAVLHQEPTQRADRVVAPRERDAARQALEDVARFSVVEFLRYKQDGRVVAFFKEDAGSFGYKVNTRLRVVFRWNGRYADQLRFTRQS